MSGLERPKIWIFNHYAGFPEVVPAVRTYELSKRLTQLGWSVTVIACSFNHYTFSDDFPEVSDPIHSRERDGVQWVFVKGTGYTSNGPRRLRNMLDYVRFSKRWARRADAPDAVIGTTVHPFAAEIARRIAREKGARYFYEITDLWPATLVDLGGTSRTSSLFRLLHSLERKSFSDADGVIGLLPLIPQYARDAHGLTLSSFCYIPNGMNLGARAPDPGSPTPGSIAWAGGFAPAHGMPTIVQLATELEKRHRGRFVFELYGDGPERVPTEKLAAQAGLNNLAFHGLVRKSQLSARLQEAELLLCTARTMPVHQYGISFNKIFDYFEASRPVVYAVDSGNDPVAEAGAGLSVPAGDIPAMAAAVVSLADRTEASLAEMGARGREFLQREHTFDALGTRLDGYLRSRALVGEKQVQ